jgi:hypothetical protein
MRTHAPFVVLHAVLANQREVPQKFVQTEELVLTLVDLHDARGANDKQQHNAQHAALHSSIRRWPAHAHSHAGAGAHLHPHTTLNMRKPKRQQGSTSTSAGGRQQ